MVIYGSSVGSKDLKNLLDSSYDPSLLDEARFEMDTALSTDGTKVFLDKENNNKVYVAHMGTDGLADWKNNLVYAVGGSKAYKKTDRYKKAKKVQQKAENKYGATNITTVGHSQGGLQASLLGGKSNEIITYNQATAPGVTLKQNANQTDIRTNKDAVSLFGVNKNKNNTYGIKTDTFNPLSNHGTSALDSNKIYGMPK